MAGYTRQSIADIIPGNDVGAQPLNDEFDALQDAFNGVTGHVHDGGSGNGPKINLTTSVTGVLPVANITTGISGATIPLLNGSNTWSNPQIFTAGVPLRIVSSDPTIRFTETDTGALNDIGANSTTGSLVLRADTANTVLNSSIVFQVDGTNVANITPNGIYSSNVTYFFGGTSSDDFINFSDSTNTFSFSADGNTGNSVLFGAQFTTSTTFDATVDSVGAYVNGLSFGSALMAATNINNPALYLKRLNDGAVVAFRRTGTTNVGSISITTSATTYNTSSDIRLKQDFQPINPDLLDQLKVYDFEWKNGDGRAYGVIAQELNETIPTAVSKGETEEDMWSVDYSKLVPLLIATVQDLKREVAELKEKLNG